jgi:hypothetical protein
MLFINADKIGIMTFYSRNFLETTEKHKSESERVLKNNRHPA